MANWVLNQIYADKTTINKIKELVVIKDEKGKLIVDFNKLIPMPEDLNITAPSWYISTIGENSVQKTLEPILKEIYKGNSQITQDQFVCLSMKRLTNICVKNDLLMRMIKGYYNIQRYGFPDWYDWCCHNWGCKWNACDSEVSEEEISFETPWSPSMKIFEELAHRGLDFEAVCDIEGEDELMRLEYKDGHVMESYEPKYYD